MKWDFGKSYKLFYLQVRESLVPLKIPTPTPASPAFVCSITYNVFVTFWLLSSGFEYGSTLLHEALVSAPGKTGFKVQWGLPASFGRQFKKL